MGHRTRFFIFVGAAAVASLALGCATVESIKPDTRTPEEIAQGVYDATEVKVDSYRRTATVSAPTREGDLDVVTPDSHYRAHLRGVTAENGAESFQLYVATSLEEGWQNFRSSRDQQEIPLPVMKVDRKKRCDDKGVCVYYEHFAAKLSREFLEARRRRGIELRVMGNGGESLVVVSPAEVDGFMRRFDAVRRAQSAPASSARSASRKSFCVAKYGDDGQARTFCEEQARASYKRLVPAMQRRKQDAFTTEARALDQCMKRHGGQLGLDWMMVEHCVTKAGSRTPAAPGGR